MLGVSVKAAVPPDEAHGQAGHHDTPASSACHHTGLIKAGQGSGDSRLYLSREFPLNFRVNLIAQRQEGYT